MWTMWDAPSDRDYYSQFAGEPDDDEDPDNELPVAAVAVVEEYAGDDTCPF